MPIVLAVLLGVLIPALSLAGCVGAIGDDDPLTARGQGGAGAPAGGRDAAGSGGTASGSSGSDAPSADCNAVPNAGVSRMRRLTRFEFDHAIEDLLGDTSRPGSALSADEATGHFGANTTAPVTLLGVEEYMTVAATVAQNALARLDQLLPCDPQRGDEACARTFIASLASKAYGRQLDAEALDELLLVYRRELQIQPPPSFTEGIGLLIQAVLVSPDFLYRPELGVPVTGVAGLMQLTDFELANRLSFLLWASIPDQSLADAAAAGELATPAGITAQATRMMSDRKFMRAVDSFHVQWLEIAGVTGMTKDASRFPNFSPKLAASMARETTEFVRSVFQGPVASLDTLLGAPYTFVDAPLAELYGVPYSGTNDAFVRVPLPPEERSGVLTHASVLTTHSHADQSSPVLRGVFVMDRVLCQELQPPPPTVDVTPPDPDPNATTRERFAEHTADLACASCHSLIDPIGFGFEAYDAIGSFRTRENGLPIDVTGTLKGTDVDGDIDGAVALIRQLRNSDRVRDCMARLWFEFSLARVPAAEDACSVTRVQDEFAASGYDLRSLILSIVASDAFRYVRAN